ncbi:MAG: Ig-like domain-containing protein [Thermoplasmatota archaeon]
MNSRTVSVFAMMLGMLVSGLILEHAFGGGSDMDVQASTRATGHTVFAEDATATWCQYCPSASEGLKELAGGRNDFRFITLVDDMVADAAQRNEELKVSGFPTVYFDGGFEYKSGSVSSGDDYNEPLDSCAERDVPDLDVDVICYDKGGSELYVEVDIANNGDSSYEGRLLVHVVEIESRYQDYDGNNYPNSLLSYAVDADITINGGSTYTTSASWIGADNQDLQGNDFSDIDSGNIVIYAAVFNARNNYKLQPSMYVAHYADEVGEAFPEEIGSSPEVSIRSPRDGRSVEGDVEISAEISSENDIDTVEVKIGQGPFFDMELSGGLYVYNWDSTDHGNGPVKITVRAIDEQSLSGVDSIEVFIENEGSMTPPGISYVGHQPSIPEDGETVTVSVDIDVYDTAVTSVELTHCVGDVCLAPIDMDSLGGDSYQTVIGPFQGGDEIMYEIIVGDDQGNQIRSAEYTFTVQAVDDPDPSEGGDGSSGASDESTPGHLIWLGAVSILALLAVLKRRR